MLLTFSILDMCKIKFCQSVTCRLTQQRLVQEIVVKLISHSFTALIREIKFVSTWTCEHAISPINNNNNNDNNTKDLWPLAMAHSFGVMLA